MRRLHTRVIFARDSFPYLGGSSTILYLLFQTLQKRLPNAECWNIVTPRMSEMGKTHFGPHWPNPKGLNNVRTFVVDGRRGVATVRRALRETPVAAIISKSRGTTAFLKRLGPTIPVWHLTSTCSIVKNAVAADRVPSMESVIRQLRTNDLPKQTCVEERQAVRLADRILFHTKNMRFWYYTFYPEYREKMAEEIFWDFPLLKRQFHHLNRTPWGKRPIDLLFVASDWKRAEKNFPLLKKLCYAFQQKNVMVIGFVPERLPNGVITFETMSQEDVLQAMVQAKVVVCPSRYDEAPNVLFEAAIAGCNLVCSKNCGNYQLADPDLVADLELPSFVEKIKLALHGYREPHAGSFSRQDLGQWLVKEFPSDRDFESCVRFFSPCLQFVESLSDVFGRPFVFRRVSFHGNKVLADRLS